MEDEPGNEPHIRKRGRPRSTTSAFAIKREQVIARRVIKDAAKLSIDGCTPEIPKHCRCGNGTDCQDFTPVIIQQVRAYLMRIGKGNTSVVRDFMIERAHMNTSKLTDPSKNLSNVRLYTFHMEKPDILSARLARVSSNPASVLLTKPAPEDMTTVCANLFFFMTGKSKDYQESPPENSLEPGNCIEPHGCSCP